MRVISSVYLEQLLDPFAPGMSKALTIIKYASITPDIFGLSFRTTSKDNKEHFFTALEFDYLKDIEKAGKLIEGWHGSTIQHFLMPLSSDTGSKDSPINLETLRAKISEHYYCLLAKVERPINAGYWSEYIRMQPGDTFKALFSHLPDKHQSAIQKSVCNVLKIDGNSVENTTDRTIIVWPKADGTTELFFWH